MADAGPNAFQDVLTAEYQALRPGSDFTSHDSAELFAKVHGSPQPFSALCLSGGGIRSATFALGVIQGLAQRGLLDKLDYMSTVSGGGFIGSWLTAWSKRAGGLSTVIASAGLGARPAESVVPVAVAVAGAPDPVAHLRDYNSYMSPKMGMLSADTWTLVATVARNLLLNWMVLLPMLVAALMLPRLYLAVLALPEVLHGATIFGDVVGAAPRYDAPVLDTVSHFWAVKYGLPVLCGGLFAVAMFNTLRYLPGVGNEDHTRADFVKHVLLPLVGTLPAYIAFDSLYYLGSQFSGQNNLIRELLAALAASMLAWLVYMLTARTTASAGRVFSPLALAVFVMAAGTAVATWGTSNFLLWSPIPKTDLSWPEYVTLGPPSILLGYVLGTVLFVGMSSRMLKDEDREWMSRSVAGVLVFCVAWMFVCGVVLIAPKWVVDWQSWVPRAVLTAGVLSAVGGAIVARRMPVGVAKAGKAWSLAALGIRLAPAVFIVAMAVVLTLAANAMMSAMHLMPRIGEWAPLQLLAIDGTRVKWDAHQAVLERAHPYLVAALVLVLLLVSQLLARFVNINTFSLHAMYRDGLVRAYIGASNPKREANKFTGFARGDDFPMHTLDARQKPLHVVNLTLNLVQANRLAWQQRKAQPFTVTALHCGNFELGYRPSLQYGGRGGITLGSAVAISGAATSPSMGSYSSPAARLIMTLLNARLGAWLGNPGVAGNRSWKHPGPRSPVACLLREAFGMTSNQTPYVYLSDGGHFENPGLYEMVLRRCRTIVVVDAEADPGLDLAGLGNALRKIRIDMAIPISFDDAALTRLRARGCRHAVATIGYSAVDPGATDGRLVYIKPLLRGNESADVDNYGRTHPDFPHEGTGKQWFDESQTESYRMLALQTIAEICGTWQGSSPHDLCHHLERPRHGHETAPPERARARQ